MAVVGLIGVLRQVLVEVVVRSWLGKARRCVVITAFGVVVVIAYLLTPAPVGVAGKL